MQQSDRQKSAHERQLTKACQYVNDMWFPVNPTQLKKIQSSFSQGVYDRELGLLIEDLKADPALFLHCVRELLKTLRDHGVVSTPKTQTELFVHAGLDTLREILQVNSDTISVHSLSSSTKLQESRFDEMFISACTTEALCSLSAIDPDLGFAVALFRQLGLALIAWNYPRVYRDAAIASSISGSFDEALARRLGFSPGMLGLRLCKAWGMPPEMLAALSDDREGQVARGGDMTLLGESFSDNLATLCRVGEALARANNPEQYPTARADWNDARNVIEDRLGLEGIRTIRARVGEFSNIFVESTPEAFHPGVALDPELRLLLRGRRKPGELPAVYKNCSVPLSASLERLYRAIEAKHKTEQILAQWKEEVTGNSGFACGYVFSLEPALRLLMPQLAFGNTTLKAAAEVHCDDRASLLSEAFRSQSPVVREGVDVHGERIYSIAGIFGFSARVGVVYVEVSSPDYLANPDRCMVHFWALTNSLTDCLSLR